MAVGVEDVQVTESGQLNPLFPLARYKKTYSPNLLAGVVWRGITNFGSHRKVVQLLKLPLLAEAAHDNHRLAYKYLTRDYLARGLSTEQRASGFMHHYRRMHETLPGHTLRQVLREMVVLHEIPAENNRFTITMCLSRDFDKEGEFSLNLHVDSEIVFLLSFTIVPGPIINSSAEEVMLVSRMQGMKGSYAGIHLATKSLHDVAPAAVLLAALQGIAVAFGVGELAAVSAARQSSFSSETSDGLKQAYDEFFVGAGLPQNEHGFFQSPIPIPLKPMSQVKKGHKIRTKEKRAFKERVLMACARFFDISIGYGAEGPVE